MQSPTWRKRMLYGLAACILLAAGISTYRKSALLAPVSVILTLAYFRRRELLKLAPLALVALVVIHFLSPGAFGSIRLSAAWATGSTSARSATARRTTTRCDRTSGPHLAFGRGYGTYDHVSYRILDSEMLARLVDTGIVGIISYLLMIASIILGGAH